MSVTVRYSYNPPDISPELTELRATIASVWNVLRKAGLADNEELLTLEELVRGTVEAMMIFQARTERAETRVNAARAWLKPYEAQTWLEPLARILEAR